MSEQTEETQGPIPSVGIYPTSQGIALETNDGTNKQVVMLSPDDASRIAINLISNIVILQMNAAMRAAAERAEVERVKNLITGGMDSSAIFKK